MLSKFMQSLGDSAYIKLRKIAEDRDITVQELIRAIVIPDWLKTVERHDGSERQVNRHRRRVTKLGQRSTVVPVTIGLKPRKKQ